MMDTANKTDAFAERVHAMIRQLREQLSTEGEGAPPAVQSEMLDELYREGSELGLTHKEIVRQLILPVADLIRPGLGR